MKILNYIILFFVFNLFASCASEEQIRNFLIRDKEKKYNINDFKEISFDKIYELKETYNCKAPNFNSSNNLDKYYFIKKYMLFKEDGFVYSAEKYSQISNVAFDGVLFLNKNLKILEKLDAVRPKHGDTIINGVQHPEIIIKGDELILKYWKTKCSVYKLIN